MSARDGKLTTNNAFCGKFMLVYFGFMRCPDICPEELNRMFEVIERLSKYLVCYQ